MTTNRINRKQQGEETKQALEILTIPTDMANMIINDIDPNAFVLWKQSCCVVQPVDYAKSMRILLIGEMAENESLLARIFPVIGQAQDSKFRETGHRFKLSLGLLIPVQKCGYVVGKEKRNLAKVQNDFNLDVIIDNGKREPIPEGNARLIILTTNIEALRGARAEIRRLEALSLDFNPFGFEHGTYQPEKQARVVRERIKVPAWYHFSKLQKAHFEEIQKSSGIDWTFDQEQSFLDRERFLTLDGETDLVLEAKKRLGKLISEIEEDERMGSTIRLFTSPTNGETEYRVTFKVPSPVWRKVIGAGGRTVKALRDRFDVGMGFLGDNYVDYPEFRNLRIRGTSEHSVKQAQDYIESEYIQKTDQDQQPKQHHQTNFSNKRHMNESAEGGSTENGVANQAGLEYRNENLGGWADSDDDSWGEKEEVKTQVSEDFGGNSEKEEDGREEEQTCWDEANEEEKGKNALTEKEEENGNKIDKKTLKEENRKENNHIKKMCAAEETEETESGADEILLLLEHKNEEIASGGARLVTSSSDGIGTGDEYFGSAASSIHKEQQNNCRNDLLGKANRMQQFVHAELGPLLQRLTEALMAKERENEQLREQLREKESECEQMRSRENEKANGW